MELWRAEEKLDQHFVIKMIDANFDFLMWIKHILLAYSPCWPSLERREERETRKPTLLFFILSIDVVS